jgi:hypothetical protein
MTRNAEWIDDQIKVMLEEGRSYAQIGSRLGVGHGRIKAIKDSIALSHEIGRHRTFTDEMMSFVGAEWLCDATISDSEMTEIRKRFHKNFTRRTLCNVRRLMSFNFHPRFTVQLMNDGHREARVHFCSGWREFIGEGAQIIFSDESRFCRCCDNTWVRGRSGQWNETATTANEKFQLGTMVWGAIGGGYRSPLMRCSHNVDSAEYQGIVMNCGMIERCNQLFGNRWWFMHDGAPCHLSEATVNWLGLISTERGWRPSFATSAAGATSASRATATRSRS